MVFLLRLFYQTQKYRLNFSRVFLTMSVCVLNYLLDEKHSLLFILAAFYIKSFSRKKSLPVKNLYLLTFPVDKAEILVVCKLYWASFFSTMLLSALIFSLIIIFIKGSSKILMDYLMTNDVSFTSDEYDSLV